MDAFPTPGPRSPRAARLMSMPIDRRDLLSLAAAAIALLGLIVSAVGVLMPQAIVLLVGIVTLAGGAGTLAGQRRRVRA